MSGESDVRDDPKIANARAVGGRDDTDRPEKQPDRHSTTGTGRSEEFVGRVAGEDVADAGETGAEKRAEQQREPTDPSDG